jgi:hypothetical protein
MNKSEDSQKDQLWGLRTQRFEHWVPKWVTQEERDCTPVVNKPNETPIQISSIICTNIAFAYLGTVFIYCVWNGILTEKVFGVKPISAFEAFLAYLITLYIRTPRAPLWK